MHNRCCIWDVVVWVAADCKNKLAEKVLFWLSERFLNILNLVNKFIEQFFKRNLSWSLSRSRKRGSRGVNLLQRGCDRGVEWGNTPSSCTSNPVNCKIWSRRLSSWWGTGIR